MIIEPIKIKFYFKVITANHQSKDDLIEDGEVDVIGLNELAEDRGHLSRFVRQATTKRISTTKKGSATTKKSLTTIKKSATTKKVATAKKAANIIAVI